MTDPLLLTPGPLTTSATVKQAAMHDRGSRDAHFMAVIDAVRMQLLQIAGLDQAQFSSILLPGSGTAALEAVLTTLSSVTARWLVLDNGVYGQRMVEILTVYDIPHVVIASADNAALDLSAVEQVLANDAAITHVAMVHCETSTGILNDIAAVGSLVKKFGHCFVVDAMSSFAGVDVDWSTIAVDCLITSANKCLQGLPGIGIVIVRQALLAAAQNNQRTYTLDLCRHWQSQSAKHQFLFTPPVQAVLALHQALKELQAEGGVAKRAQRYQALATYLAGEMPALGFQLYLEASLRSAIITTFYQPEAKEFVFDAFYQSLADQGFIIYPGALTAAKTFRIGHIGDLSMNNIRDLCAAIKTYQF